MPDPEARAIAHAKVEARARLRAVREAAPPRSVDLLRWLDPLPVWRECGTVAGYASMRGEIAVTSALESALARGVRVLLPRVVGRRLVLHAWGGEPLAIGRFGIPEPAATAPVVAATEVDLFLVPGVGFDLTGGRLGYGGGFYDRLLAPLSALRVGVCWHEQLVPAVPRAPWDEPVHAILTEQGWALPPRIGRSAEK